MLAAGAVDVVYKLYGRENRSLGFFLIATGLVWVVLHGLRMAWLGEPLRLDQPSLIYGIWAGFVVSLANILLLEAFRRLDVSQGSTIYRLNTIGVVVFSALFLGETIGLWKGLGVASGVAAVLLLYRPSSAVKELVPGLWRTGLVIAIAASLSRALYSVISKAGLQAGGDATTMILIAALCWIASGVIYLLLRESRPKITKVKLLYCAVGGFVIFSTVTTLIAAIERGAVSVVVPIANLSFVVALIASVCLGLETFSRTKLLAIALAALAIVLLAQAS